MPDYLEQLVAPFADPQVSGAVPGTIEWHNPDDGLASGWLAVRGAPSVRPRPFGGTHPWPQAVRRTDFERVGGYPHVGYGEDLIFGRLLPPAIVVPEACFKVTIPATVREIARTSRWIGRGPRFAVERPPLRHLVPPWSLLRATRWMRCGRPGAAVVQLIYDAGRLIGYVESRLRPGVRNAA
jgi:hypothetical protein